MKLLEMLGGNYIDNPDDITTELKKLNIYFSSTIRGDGSVDVSRSVEIPYDYLRIPIKFNAVSINFDCSGTLLSTLENTPRNVGKTFDCSHTNIRTLVGGPTFVGGNFICTGTDLRSLDGISRHIGGHLILHDNQQLAILPILKIKGLKHVRHEAGEIIMRHYKPDGTGDIIAFQDDLIEAGFNKIARVR